MDTLLGLAGLLALVLFVCSLLAKIRNREVGKVKPKNAKQGMIVSVVLLFVIGLFSGPPEPVPSAEPVSLGSTHQYTIINESDVSFPGRKRLNWFITAPTAASKEDRAATVVKAAKDLQQSEEVDIATVYLEVGDFAQGQGNSLAIATYIPDGCGNSGQDCDTDEWKVSASDQQLTKQELEIWKKWREHRGNYIEDGVVNEYRLIAFLADDMKLSREEVTLAYVERENIQ